MRPYPDRVTITEMATKPNDQVTSSTSPSIVATPPGGYPPSESESPVLVSSQLTLSQAVHKRRAEYTRPHNIRVKVGTWNVAALSGTEKDIGSWFVDGKGVSEHLSGSASEETAVKKNEQPGEVESVESQERRRSKKKSTIPANDPGAIPGGEEISIYALGLQEIVDISSATEALRPFNDPNPARRWKQAVAEALPKNYHRVCEQQLIGLFLVIYASEAILPTLSSVSTTSVGTGLMGYMGNKGAVTARIMLGETTRMVFVNCHLTAGMEKGSLERRNWDAQQILSRTKFEPIDQGLGIAEEFCEGIGDEDFAFWFGDLNYRLESIPGEDVRRLLMLHTRDEYKQSQPSLSGMKIEEELKKPPSSTIARNAQLANTPQDDTSSTHTAVESLPDRSTTSSITMLDNDNVDPNCDPASLQTTLSSLLPHDQLHTQMQTRKAFHDGWREGTIDFLPTYKYDVGSVGMFDSSEKRRGPSWCDRILFRTRRDKLNYEQKIRDEEEAKRKDNEMKLRGVVEAASDEAVLFDYDPETDGAENENLQPDADPDVVITKNGFEDKLSLDYYTSHQRVLSSDHKPLDAVFTLDYDAVDPDLKAQVHQEVARELDKAENEGRPVVTIVVDPHHPHDSPSVSTSSSESVDFGHVKYDHLKTRSITIANTGRVPATIGFVNRSIDSGQPGGVAPSWLSIRFDRPSDITNQSTGASQEHTLQPGDAANVELTLHIVDLDLVRRLSSGEENLEDVLVLRIQNGRDYFIPLRGTWLQSAFGRSIEKLIRIPEGGVRRLQQQKPDSSDDGVKWSAPRELFRLTETIEKLVERAVGEWEMRGEEGEKPWEMEAGWPFTGCVSEVEERKTLKESLREALDCDTPFQGIWPPEASSLQRLEAVAEILVEFLKSLEDGIVTAPLWAELEKGMLERENFKKHLSDEEERTWILDILSAAPPHSVSFTFVTFTLSHIANEIAPLRKTETRRESSDSAEASEGNRGRMPAWELRQRVNGAYAVMFAEAMVRLPLGLKEKARKVSEGRRKRVVEVFLTSNMGDGS